MEAKLQNDQAHVPAALESLVTSLGLIVSNNTVYGPEHAITRGAVDNGFAALQKAGVECRSATISVVDQNVTVNGSPIDARRPIVQALLTRLIALDLNTFTVNCSMPREQFVKFMELLTMNADALKEQGGFAKKAAEIGIGNVKARKVRFQAVEDDQIVAWMKDLKRGGAGAAKAIETPAAAPNLARHRSPVQNEAERERQQADESILHELIENFKKVSDIRDDKGLLRNADQVVLVVKEVGEQVDAVVTNTEKKIETVVERLGRERSGRSRPGEELSREQLVKVLAEIVQEFCQPLAVVSCSIDFVRSRADTMPEAESSMLELAAGCGTRLQKLMGKLTEIAGLPADLSPDRDIIASIYGEDDSPTSSDG